MARVSADFQKGRVRRLTMVVVSMGVLCFAWLTLVYLRPSTLPCAQARELVTQRHAAVFGVMNYLVGPVRFDCANVPAQGRAQVTITWTVYGIEHHATYIADAAGAVRPEDGNAASLDRLALRLEHQGGPLAPDSFDASQFR